MIVGQPQAGNKLKNFATLGHSIRDYSKLTGISTYNNNRIDFILKSLVPEIKKADQEAKKMAMEMLKHEYIRVTESLNELFNYFNIERYIDKRDEGKINTLIEEIKEAMTLAKDSVSSEEFDTLEENLKKKSSILSKIASLCISMLDNITERCIAYEYQVP